MSLSSSASTVKTEESYQDYTEDFNSSLQTSGDEISTDLCDEWRTQFIVKKLEALKAKPIEMKRKTESDFIRRRNCDELSPFLLKKMEKLQERNNNYMHKYNEPQIFNGKTTNAVISGKQEGNVNVNVDKNKIGCFQSAYKRLKFENLRSKCKSMLKDQIHSVETCKECQAKQEEVSKSGFYKKVIGNVKQNMVEDKLWEHMQTRTSALLIADIIKDGPKPTWSSDKIWAAVMSGGYQHGKSRK